MNKTSKKIILIVFDLSFFFSHRYELIKRLSNQNFEFTIVSSFKDHPPKNEKNITYHFINSSRENFNVFNLIHNSILLSRLIKSCHPDLIYAISHRSIFLARLSNIFLKKNSLYAISGMGSMFTKQKSVIKNIKTGFLKYLALTIYRLIIKGRGVNFLLQNKDDLQLLQDKKIASPSNSFVIEGNGIEDSFFHPPTAPPQRFQFIMIARILKDKGVLDFCEAAKKVLTFYPQSEFVLYGSFDFTNPHAISEKELNAYLSKKIQYKGHTHDIRSKILQSSVLVLPSYREGFSKVLMEAQACSKPVITTDISGCRDVIIKNKTGYLIQPRNTDDLATRMMEMIENPENYKDLSKNAFMHAKENFTLDTAVNKHLKIFDKIIS